MNRSRKITEPDAPHSKTRSRVVTAIKESLKSYSISPKGVFGSVAVVKSGGVTVNSEDLDIEFTIPFDDDMECNEAEIIIYNLSDSTIKQLKYHAALSVEAGYKGDTGVVFNGFIDRVSTKFSGADKVTTIKCFDDIASHAITSIAYAAGTSASYILKDLINKTGIPIAVFSVRRDYTYKDETTVDGDLMENIKKFAEVCGISVYVNKGKIYARYIKDGDNLNFTVCEDTGMIGTPESFTEEQTAEDFKETVTGYKIQMLLQHRMTTAAIVAVNSRYCNGKFRVRSGQHTFNESEAITEIEVI